ncbi:hypothetical protein Tco_1497744, partial [Tanacetum coccineum]
MRRVNASTFWRRHGRDISSSSSSRYLFLDFHLLSTVLVVRTWRTVTQGVPLSQPAMDIATAQPITDADASIVVFMSVQVLQVSLLSARNFPSNSTEYWRSTVIPFASFLLVARWRYFVLRTEVKSGL